MSQPQDPVQDLVAEVSGLRDLFQRRLLEDRGRQQLYDRLYAELEFSRHNLVRHFIAPMCRELVLLLDRVRSTDTDEPGIRALVTSIEDEIGAILERRGVREVHAAGQTFDPAVHEAVDQIAVAEPAAHGVVTSVRRRGYAIEEGLLRPAQVIVGHYADPG